MAMLAPLLQTIGPLVAGAALDLGKDWAKKKFHLKKGGKVGPYNNKPRNLKFAGGRITHKRGMTRYQHNNDSVRALLMPGEIVIPKFYQKNKRKINLAGQVEQYLKKRKVILPGM